MSIQQQNYSGVHPRVSTLIQPSFQQKKKKKKPTLSTDPALAGDCRHNKKKITIFFSKASLSSTGLLGGKNKRF